MLARAFRFPLPRAATAAAAAAPPRRFLNLHEYQTAEIMASFKVGVPRGGVVTQGAKAADIARSIGGRCVVKAQVLAGGRGLGKFNTGFKGGVHVVETPEAAAKAAEAMLGNRLITKQTGADGRPCNTVLVVEPLAAKMEKYFAILYDRSVGGPLIIASAKGGVTIEDIAEKDPSCIIKEPVDISKGLTPAQASAIATKMQFATASATKQAADAIQGLYKMFIEKDCTMVEVNPFMETTQGNICCVDSKVNFDDNAAFRQKEIFALRDFSQEDANEVAASKFDLNYIQLDGSIGCLVNGAGLAMATLDIINLHGGKPANFLDVGGGANEKQVCEAFKILQGDSKVKAILVNIFGGIMKCDVIAQGVINAAKQLNLSIPLVVRLQGTNVEQANKLLAESGLKLLRAKDLDDAAKQAVAAIKQ